MSTPGAPPPGGVPPAQQPPAGAPPYGGQQYGAGQQYGGGQYQQPGGGGGGIGDRASGVADTLGRHVKTPETKEFFKTSEFLVWLLTVLGILVAAAVISGDGGDNFLGDEAWRYVTIVSSAYIVSRGLSKAATRRGHGDAPMDRG